LLGTLIGEIQTQGSSPLFEAIVPQLLAVGSVSGLSQAYDTVGGGAVSLVPQALMGAASGSLASIASQLDRWRTGTRIAGPATAPAPSAEAGAGGSLSRALWAAPMGNATTGGGLSGSSFGGSIGIDGELASLPLLLGGAVNYSETDLSANAYGATTTTGYGGVSLYGLYRMGPAYVSAIATLGYGSSNFDRNLHGLGLNLATSSGFDGTVFGGRIEAGYSVPLDAIGTRLTPFAAFQPMGLRLGSGSERFGLLGPGFSYDSTTITALPIYLGVQLDAVWAAGNGTSYAPFLRAAWMHDFSPNRDVPRSFAELPNFSFSASAIPTVSDAVDIHAGIQFAAGPNVSLSAGLDAQLAASYSTIGASAALRVRW
jgi:outer membrane autotransporter protein